tara:strand:- start:429 stop:1721 length:1293 start_codon:yes stop_codon:yes gene_type:complete
MNEYDSEKLNELLKFNGYKLSKNFENSDIAILNTCNIREKASEKLYSDLGRLSKFKENKAKIGKKMHIIVTGCVAQAQGEEILKRNKNVDYIFGPQNFHQLPSILKKSSSDKVFNDFLCEEKFSSLSPSSSKDVSKLVTIQEGCDKFCSFCVVPYTRGAEFSRLVEDIYAEVNTLVNNGAKEITLLGQNVSSYESNIYKNGQDIKIKLSGLCKSLSRISGLERIRYLTSHPLDIDEALIKEHKNNNKLMPFLHLPIQSGSDDILKKMNRKHTKKFYLDLISQIKKQNENMAFSSDFIVGFPGETDRDFQETIDLIEKVGFASSYSFKYSSRPGTPSSTINKNIDEEVMNVRLRHIQGKLNKQQKDFNLSFLDKNVNVLFTGKGNKTNQFVGRTPYLQPVHVFSENNLTGKLLKVKILELTSFSFHGKLCE